MSTIEIQVIKDGARALAIAATEATEARAIALVWYFDATRPTWEEDGYSIDSQNAPPWSDSAHETMERFWSELDRDAHTDGAVFAARWDLELGEVEALFARWKGAVQ
jgi:hypothetical protein